MRRLVGISVRGTAVTTLLLAGAVYLAAEARQAMTRRYSLSQPDVQPIPGSGAARQPRQKLDFAQAAQADELAAEQQASQLPAPKLEKPASKDPHTRQIVISLPDRQLALLVDGELIKVYAVAVGTSETPSPEGDFTIINHAVDPTYRHDGKEIPPGKSNPLGTRWMGLSLKGYGIHGTNVQSSVGKAASHGCFRLKKKDVEELYSLIKVGDAVFIRGERDELTASLFAADDSKTIAETVNKPEAQIAASSN
jgi:lipoprotein-anchoring transpeptidase ErfK/SrfK